MAAPGSGELGPALGLGPVPGQVCLPPAGVGAPPPLQPLAPSPWPRHAPVGGEAGFSPYFFQLSTQACSPPLGSQTSAKSRLWLTPPGGKGSCRQASSVPRAGSGVRGLARGYQGRQRPGPRGDAGGEGAGVGGAEGEGDPQESSGRPPSGEAPAALCLRCSSSRAPSARSRAPQAGSARARRARQAP